MAPLARGDYEEQIYSQNLGAGTARALKIVYPNSDATAYSGLTNNYTIPIGEYWNFTRFEARMVRVGVLTDCFLYMALWDTSNGVPETINPTAYLALINANALSTSSGMFSFDVNEGAGYVLESGHNYAIGFFCYNGTLWASTRLVYWYVTTSTTDTIGGGYYSSAWNALVGNDHGFTMWGYEILEPTPTPGPSVDVEEYIGLAIIAAIIVLGTFLALGLASRSKKF